MKAILSNKKKLGLVEKPIFVIILLFIMLIFTFWIWQNAKNAALKEAQLRFDNEVVKINDKIIDRMYNYEQVLKGGLGLFRANEEVTRAEWRVYAQELKLEQNYPGIHGIGFIKRITAQKKNAHIKQIQSEGFPDYKIYPEGDRKEYYPIIFLEPFLQARNIKAFGYDVSSEAVRRAGLEKSRDEGVTTLTGRIILVQETEIAQQNGFLMYLPLYRNDLPHNTALERQNALIGFVYSPFRINDLMEGIMGSAQIDCDIHIYDGNEINSANLLYDFTYDSETQKNYHTHNSKFTETITNKLFGKIWTIQFHSLPVFDSALDIKSPLIILICGILISLLCAGILFMLIARIKKIIKLNQLTSNLQESELQYRMLFENSADGIMIVDYLTMMIKFANPSICRMFGYTHKELVSLSITDIHPKEHLQKIIEGFKSQSRDKQSNGTDIFCLRKDGTIFIADISAGNIIINDRDYNMAIFHDITERKGIEMELKNSNEFKRSIIESSLDCIKTIDTEGRLLYMSDGGQRLLEIEDIQPYLGQIWIDFWKEVDRKPVKKAISEAARGGIGRFQAFSPTVKGKPKWWDVIISPIVKSDGSIDTLLAVSRDITEYKLAEDEWEKIFDTVTDMITIHDMDFNIIRANKAAQMMMGSSNILGTKCYKSYHGGANPPADCPSCSSFKKGQTVVVEFYEPHLNRNLEVRAIPRRDNNGKIIGLVHIVRDITERKKGEASIIASEMRYRRLFESAKDGIIILDAETGQIVDVNPYLINLLGFSYENFQGKKIWEIGLFKDIAANKEAFRKLQENEYIRFDNLPLETTTGQIIFVEFISNVYSVEKNKVIQCNIRNMTAHRKNEEEKQKIYAQLLQAQKMESIGTLVGGIAHDFNNLLQVICGYSESLMRELSKDNPLYADITEINGAGRKAAGLTRQLLAFSRKQIFQISLIDIYELIMNLNKMIKRLIGEDIEMVIISKSKFNLVNIDPGQIEQMIINLIVNARDAMPEGGTLIIKTENVQIDKNNIQMYPAGRPGLFLRLTISDTGQGIPENIINNIFEPFFTTKEIGKGTGLGLSVVYGIINQHNGWITVCNKSASLECGLPEEKTSNGKNEHGAVFSIYLPISQEKKEEIISMENTKRIYGAGEKILIVEDEIKIRIFTANILKDSGYNVKQAGNFDEAMELFVKEDFDLVFSDAIMPGKSGMQLVEELLIRKPDLKILLCSGYTDSKSKITLISEKGYPFLQKPYRIEKLLEMIKTILDKI